MYPIQYACYYKHEEIVKLFISEIIKNPNKNKIVEILKSQSRKRICDIIPTNKSLENLKEGSVFNIF